jgi:hypothetical protein
LKLTGALVVDGPNGRFVADTRLE